MAIVRTDDCTALEMLIDRTSVSAVLEAIREVYAEKAEHIRTNWQDMDLARSWDRVAECVNHTIGAVVALEGGR